MKRICGLLAFFLFVSLLLKSKAAKTAVTATDKSPYTDQQCASANICITSRQILAVETEGKAK